MNKNFYVILLIIITLTISVQGIPSSLLYPTTTSLENYSTNNSYLSHGFDEVINKLIIGNINASLYYYSIDTETLNTTIIGLPNFSAYASYSVNDKNTIIRLKNNLTYWEPEGLKAWYTASNGVNRESDNIIGAFKGFTQKTGNVYHYTIYDLGGGNGAFYKWEVNPSATDDSTVLVPQSFGNCYTDLENKFTNTYNLTFSPSIWTTIEASNNNTKIQTNETVYFKIQDRWFYFDENNDISSCSNIMSSLNEAVVDVPTPSTVMSSIIYNNTLYQSYKTGSNVLRLDKTASAPYTCGVDANGNTTCIDSTNFCVHPIFSGTNTSKALCSNTTITDWNNIINPSYNDPVNMYCGEDVTYCNEGCTNTLAYDTTYNVSYYTGVCSISSNCTNECYIYGERNDTGVTTYSVCGNYDTDVCLDLQTVTCGLGEIAYGGICVNKTNNVSLITKLNFGIIPYLSLYRVNCGTGIECLNNNLWNVSYTSSVNPPRLDVVTTTQLGGTGVFPFAMQVNYPNTTHYLAMSCKYESTLVSVTKNNLTIVKGYSVEKIQNNKTVIINGVQSMKEKISFVNNETSITRITVSDAVGKSIQNLYLIINNSNGDVLLYKDDTTGTLLLSYNYGSSNNLGLVTIDLWNSYYYQNQNALVSTYLYINDANQPLLKTYGYSTMNYHDTSATIPYSVSIVNVSGNIYLADFTSEYLNGDVPPANIRLDTQIPTGSGHTFTNGYEYYPCTYNSDGCFTGRVYLMENLLGQYFSYQDIQICKKEKGTGAISTTGKLSKNFSETTKLLIAIGVSAFIFLVAIITGFLVESRVLTNICIWGGVFLSVGLIIYFTAIKWIPAWVIIVMLALASLTIVMFFRKLFFNEGGE